MKKSLRQLVTRRNVSCVNVGKDFGKGMDHEVQPVLCKKILEMKYEQAMVSWPDGRSTS